MTTVLSNLFQAQVTAPDIIVAQSTNDDLATAISNAPAGSVIEMQASNPGVPWVYTSDVFLSGVNTGSEGNEITIRVRQGDRVNFYPTSTTNIFTVNDCSYLIFDGTLGEWYIGNRGLWSTTNGGTDTYTHSRTMYIVNGSHHLDFRSIHISGGNGYASSTIGGFGGATQPCHHIRLLNCTGYGHGYVKASGGDRGDGWAVGGHQIIFEGWESNHFGGHNQLQGSGAALVVRNCVFDAKQETDQIAGTGYRAWGFQKIKEDNFGYDGDVPFGPTLVEGTITKGAGGSATYTTTNGGYNSRTELGGNRVIYRFNYEFDNIAADGQFIDEVNAERAQNLATPAELVGNTEHHRIYNNTEDNNIGWIMTAGVSGSPFNGKEYHWVNNIVSNCTSATQSINGPTVFADLTNMIVTWRNTKLHDIQGYPDRWLGAKWDNNMIDADIVGVHLHYWPGESDPDNPGAIGHVNSLTSAKTKWPNVWLASNNENAPTYENGPARTKAGYALTNTSSGRDEAVHMATVSNPVTNGIIIPLDDAYWIYDGFDLSYFGEVGDYIAFYDSDGTSNLRIRQVESVDSQTQITLTSAVTVASGDKVWPVLSDGVTVCKNIGASQI
jgi:hypothetical protein